MGKDKRQVYKLGSSGTTFSLLLWACSVRLPFACLRKAVCFLFMPMTTEKKFPVGCVSGQKSSSSSCTVLFRWMSVSDRGSMTRSPSSNDSAPLSFRNDWWLWGMSMAAPTSIFPQRWWTTRWLLFNAQWKSHLKPKTTYTEPILWSNIRSFITFNINTKWPCEGTDSSIF